MQKKLAIIIFALLLMQFFVSCERKTAEVKAVFTLNCEDNETLPCIVNFENQSLNSESYLWNFGDGTVSTEENPSHQYTEKGDYKVILTANNKAGKDTVSQMFSVKDYRDKWVGEYKAISNGRVLLYVKSYIITAIKDSTIRIDICSVYQKQLKFGEDWHALELKVSKDGIIYNRYWPDYSYCNYYGYFYAEDSVKLTYPYWDLEGEGEIIFKGKKIKN